MSRWCLAYKILCFKHLTFRLTIASSAASQHEELSLTIIFDFATTSSNNGSTLVKWTSNAQATYTRSALAYIHLQKCLSSQKYMVVYHQGHNQKRCITILLVIGWANFLRTGLVLYPAAPRSEGWANFLRTGLALCPVRRLLKPRVTFSEKPSMQLYHIDPLYANSKSYSNEDVRRFSTTFWWKLRGSRILWS